MIHIAILGVGSIAEKMAQTLNGMEGKDKEFCCYGGSVQGQREGGGLCSQIWL